MQKVAILAIMEVWTTKPYYPWENKSESVIKIIKGESKRRRVRRNIPKRFWDFGTVWGVGIYFHTAGNDGRPALERLTGDTVDISEWLEVELYDLVWFWNNQSHYIQPMLEKWLGLSHRVGTYICYWIIGEKGKFLYWTTVRHLTYK